MRYNLVAQSVQIANRHSRAQIRSARVEVQRLTNCAVAASYLTDWFYIYKRRAVEVEANQS